MKKFCSTLILSLLVAFLMGLCSVGVNASVEVPTIYAGSAVVLDADTGVYYYEKNADTRRAQASMTKLMTAYMIFEEIDAGRLDFDSVITIGYQGQKVAYTGGYSNVPLNYGEQYTVDTMLKLILLPSACGACAAMGEAISGSETAFVAEMNETAEELGLDAHFMNTYGAGVGMPSHYITPRSQALLALAFLNNHPDILKYTSLNSVSFKGRTYYNTNHFLNTDYYEGVDGMKTGTNGEAGGCITVTAEKDGRRIIVVVMKSGVRYSDARKLLDYGFARVEESDNAAKNAAFALSGTTRDEIRVGTDFEVSASASNVEVPFVASGYWMANGEKVAEFNGVSVSEGGSIVGKLNLDDFAGNDVTVGLVLTLPDGSLKTTEAVFSFSDEVPCAFRDIDGHWAEPPITQMKELGVLNGYGDGTFLPQKSITRAEFVTALIRSLGMVELFAEEDSFEGSGFVDCEGHWADPYIAEARILGIAKGITEDTFAPDQPITRQEIAVFIARAFGLEGADGNMPNFSDSDEIADWAIEAVIACAEQGIIKGYPEGHFAPAANATRAETAQIFANIAAWIDANQPPVESDPEVPEDPENPEDNENPGETDDSPENNG